MLTTILSRRKTNLQFILVILISSTLLSSILIGTDYTSAHSIVAYPTEIFSIWNNTNPTIDGDINFENDNSSLEWDFAAIYNLYTSTESIGGKIYLQNDNDDLYIGLDGLSLTDSSPATDWGFAIYFDIDHNGFLTSKDRSLRFLDNSSGAFIEFMGYDPADAAVAANDIVLLDRLYSRSQFLPP